MPYTPPNVFVDGAIISALDVEENIVAAGVYINSGIVASDIEEGSVKTKHIVRPSFFRVTGAVGGANFETGSVISLKGPPFDSVMSAALLNAQLTFNGFAAITLQPDTGITNWRPVNKTGISFYVDVLSAVHIEYSGELVSPDTHTTSPPVVNRGAISIDGTPNSSSLFYWDECTIGTVYEMDNMRRSFQTHVHLNLTAGWHHCSIVTGLASNIAFVGAINGLVEVHNIVNI